MSFEDQLTIKIAECCAVCTYSPFIAKKTGIEWCKKKGAYVSPYCICDEWYDPDDKRKARRMGGLRSAMRQRILRNAV